MNHYYADSEHVVEAFENVKSEAEFANPVRLSIHKTDVCMRGIDYEECESRNLPGNWGQQIATITYKGGCSIDLKFHESMLDSKCVALDLARATTMPDVMYALEMAIVALTAEYDMTWDLAKLDAASQGYSGLTDYEFTFEGLGSFE